MCCHLGYGRFELESYQPSALLGAETALLNVIDFFFFTYDRLRWSYPFIVFRSHRCFWHCWSQYNHFSPWILLRDKQYCSGLVQVLSFWKEFFCLSGWLYLLQCLFHVESLRVLFSSQFYSASTCSPQDHFLENMASWLIVLWEILKFVCPWNPKVLPPFDSCWTAWRLWKTGWPWLSWAYMKQNLGS